MGREGAFRDRADSLYHVRDAAGILDDHLAGFFLPEIVEFRQHFLGRAQIERGLLIGVGKTLPGLEDPAVNLILRVHEMDIACRADRDMQLLAEAEDGAVELAELFLGLHHPLPQHEEVIA